VIDDANRSPKLTGRQLTGSNQTLHGALANPQILGDLADVDDSVQFLDVAVLEHVGERLEHALRP